MHQNAEHYCLSYFIFIFITQNYILVITVVVITLIQFFLLLLYLPTTLVLQTTSQLYMTRIVFRDRASRSLRKKNKKKRDAYSISLQRITFNT